MSDMDVTSEVTWYGVFIESRGHHTYVTVEKGLAMKAGQLVADGYVEISDGHYGQCIVYPEDLDRLIDAEAGC